MDNDHKLKFRLLDDKPTSTDNFNAHNRVAASIADMIISEEGGKSISLIGHWGSGKSSIIEILKNKLKDKCRVFIFNAWAHEGDPLRRAFLESLISFFTANKLIKKEDWEEKLKELSGNKEKSEITDKKNPSKYGLIIIFFTTLLPVALVILSLWPNISYFMLCSSILFSLGPVLVFLVFLIRYYNEKDEEKKKSVLSIIINDIEKTVTSTSYKTVDPTSLEFQKEFHSLMSEATQHSESKLLIVIDNLDRISDEDALKIWSTMRTFFDFDNREKVQWLNKTWLLVPYDYDGLKKLWKNDGEHQGNKGSLITSFTEKTFQVTFNTPLLILSDSKKFFDDQFKHAFIGYKDDNEIHKVYRIFKELREPNNLPPTPREIKLFINQIVSFYAQWKEEIPIHIIALFILLRKNKWSDDNELISALLDSNTDFLIPSLKDLVHEEYREYLAALYFNTEKDKALQLLLREKLEKSLINREEEFIKSNENSSGFTYVCEEIIQNNYESWAKQEPNTLAAVCYSLSLLSVEEDDNIHRSWNLIYRGFAQIETWKSLQINSSEGICTALKRKKDEAFSKTVLVSLSKSSLCETQKGPEDKTLVSKSKEKLEELIESLLKVFACITELSQLSIINESFVVNSSPDTYLDLMLILSSKAMPTEMKSFFMPSCDKNLIVQRLTQRITSEAFKDNNYFSLIKLLHNLPLNLNWAEIVRSIDSRLQNITLNTIETLNLLHSLMFLRKKEASVESVLKNLTMKGFIPHQLSIALKQKDIHLQALAIYNIIEFAYPGQLQQNVGESPQGINFYKQVISNPNNNKEIVGELLNLMINYDTVNDIFTYNKETELKILAEEIVIQLHSNKEFNKWIASDKFLKEETFFYNCLPLEAYYDTIKDYVGETNILSQVLEIEFKRELASLYIGIIKTEKGRVPEIIDYIKNGLLLLNQKDWQEEHSVDRVNCFDLIVELYSHSIYAGLKSAFLDQLKLFVENIMKGQSLPANKTSNWKAFVLALDEDNQKTLLKFFITKINNENFDLSNILKLFSQDIIKCEVFIDDANDLVTQGFDKILSRKILLELNWMNELLKKCPQIIEKSDSAYTASLKDKIKGTVKEEGITEESKNLIKEIGKLIGIKKFIEEQKEQ